MLLASKPVQAVWVKGNTENNPNSVGEIALAFTNSKTGQTQNVAIDIMPWGIMILCENTPFGVRVDSGNYITVNLEGVYNDNQT